MPSDHLRKLDILAGRFARFYTTTDTRATWVQVGGFLQRIDYVRKYAFGVMCILKNSEGQFPIRGFWIFRGQDIPQMMKDECYDLELYEWQKLDSKNLQPVSLLHCCSHIFVGLRYVEGCL